MDWNAAKTTTVNIPKWETAKYHYVSDFNKGIRLYKIVLFCI